MVYYVQLNLTRLCELALMLTIYTLMISTDMYPYQWPMSRLNACEVVDIDNFNKFHMSCLNCTLIELPHIMKLFQWLAYFQIQTIWMKVKTLSTLTLYSAFAKIRKTIPILRTGELTTYFKNSKTWTTWWPVVDYLECDMPPAVRYVIGIKNSDEYEYQRDLRSHMGNVRI